MSEWFLKYNDNSLMQGDIIIDCPVVVPPKVIKDNQDFEFYINDVIILTQSCDLDNNKVNIVLVASCVKLEEFLKEHSTSKDGTKKGREKVVKNLTEGNYPSFHILEKHIDLGDYLVVDFRSVYGVHIDYLKTHLKNQHTKIRLNSPYREHLSQAFARFFMRVGLPNNLKVQI